MKAILLVLTMTLQAFATVQAAEPGAAKSSAAGATRTRAEVLRKLDREKGKFYAVYARALREKPGLAGKIVLSFSIAPDGKVTKCTVVSSTLEDPGMRDALVERLQAIDFGAKGTKVYHHPDYELSFFAAD